MTLTQRVFHLGRLVLLILVITQAIIFSAHIANIHGDSRYYAIALVALPMLSVSWWYFAKPPSDRIDRPKFVWLTYALTVITFQILVFGTTDTETQDSSLLHIANVLTPFIVLVSIASGCEQSLRDAAFVVASGVAIVNAFDASDAYVRVAQNVKNVPSRFWGSLVGVASVMLVWSALEFTVRSRLTRPQAITVSITCGLHGIHLFLNLALFSLRTILYINGWVDFSIMIAKNAMVFAVRLVYILSMYGLWWESPPKPAPFVVPTAPPPMAETIGSKGCSERPPTPMPQRAASYAQSQGHQDQEDRHLYPILPKRVHFSD